MTSHRPDALHHVFAHAEAAFNAAPRKPPESPDLAGRVFRALDEPGTEFVKGSGQTLPACTYLSDALDSARNVGGPVMQLAGALGELSEDFTWQRRAGAQEDGTGFFDGHANTYLVGPHGLERRDDVLAGLSLIAPNVRYVDHQHPPEEFYVVLTPGQWRQEEGPWHEPGPGGVVHNPCNIVHAMRSGDSPLLALWFLWTR